MGEAREVALQERVVPDVLVQHLDALPHPLEVVLGEVLDVVLRLRHLAGVLAHVVVLGGEAVEEGADVLGHITLTCYSYTIVAVKEKGSLRKGYP